jgi:deoxyinosine 3'endonuclease (endonuclease V)
MDIETMYKHQEMYEKLSDKILNQTTASGIMETWDQNKFDINYLKSMDSMRYSTLTKIYQKNLQYYKEKENVRHARNNKKTKRDL